MTKEEENIEVFFLISGPSVHTALGEHAVRNKTAGLPDWKKSRFFSFYLFTLNHDCHASDLSCFPIQLHLHIVHPIFQMVYPVFQCTLNVQPLIYITYYM